MAVRFVLLVFVFCVIYGVVKVQCDVEGFYWRDFTGEIPSDALPGGRDVKGKPIYIGQIFNLRFLIPAKIYVNDRKAYYEYGGEEFSETNNVKILCTTRPEQFEWIKTNNDEIKHITDKQLVIGGFEPGCTTYIGRVRQGGEIAVGKALTDNLPIFSGLHVTSEGKGIRHTSFDVLAFNPKLARIDVRTGSSNNNPIDDNNNNSNNKTNCNRFTILMFS